MSQLVQDELHKEQLTTTVEALLQQELDLRDALVRTTLISYWTERIVRELP